MDLKYESSVMDYHENVIFWNHQNKITKTDGVGEINHDILRNWHYCWSKFNYYCKHDGYVFAFRKTFPNLIRSLKGMIISIIKFNYQNFDKHLAEFKGILSAYFRLSSYYRINQYNL